tara:strand:+ start:730 stop:1629 length:900 start_codon:yes stop_codon:yes gene_type:complete
MGYTLPNATAVAYYDANGSHGQYAFIRYRDVVRSFIASYIGPGKICEGVLVEDVAFWAGRGMQELSYDTLHSHKAHEYVVPPSLVMFLPRDYVNYVKFTWSDSAGMEHTIMPARFTSNPTDIKYNATTDSYAINSEEVNFPDETSDTLEAYNTQSSNTASDDYDYNDPLHELSVGQRYGLEPELANSNGTFYIDNKTGKVHYSSNLSGKTVIIKYISDGMNSTDHDAEGPAIHKFAEEALMKYIGYNCLLARSASPPALVQMFKKELSVEKRKAKIRLSNFKLEEFTQILRGKSKQIKH